MLQSVSVGIMLSIALIIFLEIFRFIRRLINSSKEIDELKRKVNNIEEILKKWLTLGKFIRICLEIWNIRGYLSKNWNIINAI